MKELEYPFDAEGISLKKKLRRLLLELFLLDQGIRPTFYESEYNQYYQDAAFPNERMEAFSPDAIWLHTTSRNITRYPALTDSPQQVEELLDGEMRKFTEIWESLTKRYHCPILQNNFGLPCYRPLGNRDGSDIRGRVHFVNRLNERFSAYAQTHENFYILHLRHPLYFHGLRAEGVVGPVLLPYVQVCAERVGDPVLGVQHVQPDQVAVREELEGAGIRRG